MTRSLKSFWKKLVHTGADEHTPEQLVRMITLTNRFCLAGVGALLLGALHTYYLEDNYLGTVILSFMFLFPLGIFINRARWHYTAIVYLLLLINCAVFYFDSYCGPDAGVYFYYFPLMLAISLLLDFSKPRMLIAFLGITVAFLTTTILTGHRFFINPMLSAWQVHSMWNFNLLNSVLIVFYCVYLVTVLNNGQLRELRRQVREREEAEEKIKTTLREKETLLAEVHHRVKNNLAVVSSLLNLQSNLVNNSYTRDVLIDSKNRIASMALIHQKLYSNNSFSEIDFSKYIEELVQEIRLSYPEELSDDIRIDLESENCLLDLTMAIPCGLIMNELLSNCYKHAFREKKKDGIIRIRFKEYGTACELEVSDNGCGLPPGFDTETSSTLGMTIITSLAGQLDARHRFSNNPGGGMCFHMSFNPAPSKSRH